MLVRYLGCSTGQSTGPVLSMMLTLCGPPSPSDNAQVQEVVFWEQYLSCGHPVLVGRSFRLMDMTIICLSEPKEGLLYITVQEQPLTTVERYHSRC